MVSGRDGFPSCLPARPDSARPAHALFRPVPKGEAAN